MLIQPQAKEPPASTWNLNGYTLFNFLPLEGANSPSFGAYFPRNNLIALNQQTHEEFLVTKIPKAELNSQKYALIGNELNISQHLQGLPNLRTLCDVVDYQEHLFLFYSSVKGLPEITLLDYLKQMQRLDEEEGQFIFGQLVRCLMDCQERMVAHSDLKLPAVFINPVTRRIRLGEFQHAVILQHSNEMVSDRKGSPAYVSPEILQGKPYQPFKSDNWALGIILYALLSGTFPYNGSSPKDLFLQIRQCLPISFSNDLSSPAIQSIRGLLQHDPHQRWHPQQLLHHDWLAAMSNFASLTTGSQMGANDNGDGDSDEDQIVPEM
jgi:serine/threonine protein kinase